MNFFFPKISEDKNNTLSRINLRKVSSSQKNIYTQIKTQGSVLDSQRNFREKDPVEFYKQIQKLEKHKIKASSQPKSMRPKQMIKTQNNEIDNKHQNQQTQYNNELNLPFHTLHKNLEKIMEKEQFYNNKSSKLTFILKQMQKFNIPPKKLQLIKQKGNKKSLNLKNYGLNSENNSKFFAEILSKIPQFDTLDISNNFISIYTIQKLIPNFAAMINLNLNKNRIGKTGCVLIGNLFKQSDCRIQILEMESNNFTDRQGISLIQNLFGYNRLKKLNLSNNKLSDSFIMKFSSIIQQPGFSLRELYLHWNEIHIKGANTFFKAMGSNQSMKVLDLSWNFLKEKNESFQNFQYFLKNNKNCLHLDLSYCNLPFEICKKIKGWLQSNNSLIGLHLQGNFGYINYKGNFILQSNQSNKQANNYPLPLIKSTPVRINGVELKKQRQKINSKQTNDACWICDGYEQITFKIKRPNKQQQKQCFIHLSLEQYNGIKLNLQQQQYWIKRMCPPQKLQFFFTFGRNEHTTSTMFDKIKEKIVLDHFSIGKVQYKNILIQQFNVVIGNRSRPISQKFEILVECRPRTLQNKILLKNVSLLKKKVQKYEKINFTVNNLPEYNQDQAQIDDQQIQYQNCLNFDLKNSKILNIVKQSQIQPLKAILLKYYKYLWVIYCILSSTNANSQGVYSINQQRIIDFSEQSKIITKKIPISKILVKFYSAIANQKHQEWIMRRPQFIQLLIRIAQEKWVNQSKSNQSKVNYSQESKLNCALPEAVEKVLKCTIDFYRRYNPMQWRVAKYLTPDIKVVLNLYQKILQKIFQKYKKGKQYRTLKGIYLVQFFNIFQKALLFQNRQQFIQAQIAFQYSKKLEVIDGIPSCLNFEQFCEAIIRVADILCLSPIGFSSNLIFQIQANKKQIPLFLKAESLIYEIYRFNKQFHTNKWNKLFQKGIFKDEIEMYIEIVEERKQDKDIQTDKKFNIKAKFNKMEESNTLTIKELQERLKIKYANKYVKKYQTVEMLVEIDD